MGAECRGSAGVGGLVSLGAVAAYTVLGAALFKGLEGGRPYAEGTPREDPAAALRARTVERLWALTEDLNILYKDNWTELAARELDSFRRNLAALPPALPPPHPPWTLSASLLYALTLITTIGQSEYRVVSSAGRAAAVLYAGVGIPLVTAYLAHAGGALAAAVTALWARLCPAASCPQPAATTTDPALSPFQAALNQQAAAVVCGRSAGHGAGPAAVSGVAVAVWVCVGAAGWAGCGAGSAAEGAAVAVRALSTLGPLDAGSGPLAALCSLYVLLGMPVVACCVCLLRPPAPTPARASPPVARTPRPSRPPRRSVSAVELSTLESGRTRHSRTVTFRDEPPDLFM